jgi:hypothetical protein
LDKRTGTFARKVVELTKDLVWWGSPFWTVFKWFCLVVLGYVALISVVVALDMWTS